MGNKKTNFQQFVGSQKESLKGLADYFSKFDSTDILTNIAALQIMPENADRTLRLEALSHVAASTKNDRGFSHKVKRKIGFEQLEKICRYPSGELANVAMNEDPFGNIFTEEFTFIGGSYIVFPGIAEESTFILRHLAQAIFLNAEAFSHSSFREMARAVLGGVLAISHEVAKRAGLSRGIEPISDSEGDLLFPDPTRLAKLRHAVCFTKQEFHRLLSNYNIALFEMENLIVQKGNFSIATYQPDDGQLLISPIVKDADNFIIAIPGMLLSAARNEIVRLANECGVTTELADRYHESIWSGVIDSLSYINHLPTFISPPQASNTECFHDAFFSFDRDKLAYVICLTDPLTDYNSKDPFGRWELATETLEAKLQRAYEFAFTELKGVNEILLLLVCQGIGRTHMQSLSPLPLEEPLLFLVMGAADLEIMALLEANNPLSIFKYTWSSWKLSKTASVLCLDELDRFSFYRSKEYTFYSYDEGKPSFVIFPPGGAGELRREISKVRDWHASLSYTPNRILEVTSLFDTRDIPVYMPRSVLSQSQKRIAVLVEGLALPIWIINCTEEDGFVREYQPLYAEFTRTIAYWLWQFTPALHSTVQNLSLTQRTVNIELLLEPHESWFHSQLEESNSATSPIKTQAINANTLHIIISHQITELLRKSDNEGERYLMRHILSGFRYLLSESAQVTISDQIIEGILDCYAPLGIKKMLLNLDGNINPELDERGLPAYRKIQEADQDGLLDELGDYLHKIENIRVGEIQDDKRTQILNKAVNFFYTELVKLISTLNPEGLLEFLIAHHEAIVREVASHRMTIPTRIACFSSETKMVEDLRKEIPERSGAALASRFVIEFVVAQPPNGVRPISLSVYDRLQALASEIVNFGFESDLIQNELADIKRSMLPSGRLGANRDDYEAIRSNYISIFAGGEIMRSTDSFQQHWYQSSSTPKKPSVIEQMDDAAQIEFGFSLQEIQEILGVAAQIGNEIDSVVAIMQLDEFTRRISNVMGWTLERVNSAIQLLSLTQRPDFLKPSPPYQGYDVYPWRFNRALSYLRRPFLLRKGNRDIEVIWGIRHLNTVGEYLIFLCRSGRLKAESKEMKQIMSDVKNRQTESFNDKVADLIQKNSRLIVERRIKKFGKARIQSSSGDLGDIDVLVIDPEKHLIIAIECKDFTVARTPHDMKNEFDTLFLGRGKNKSTIVHHQERVNWLYRHLSEVLNRFGFDDDATWNVEALIVTSYELTTPHLLSPSIPVISLFELSKKYAT
jgi:hypothetical protein